MPDVRRSIPGVDQLMVAPPFRRLLERYPRDRVVVHLREVLDDTRQKLGSGETSPGVLGPALFAQEVERLFQLEDVPSLRPVINCSGVVLHTNLGRAPWAPAAREAVRRALGGYSNLEYDLDEGRRGSRYTHCVALLRELTGAEDALVVNNCAAALVLAMNTLALDQDVVVSRGELVEIGGGFRIPEILSQSGTRLREVGTTNKTRLEDYRAAVRDCDAPVLLKVHRSNFRISGFTEEASLRELADLATEEGLYLVFDLGTGLLIEPERLGLPPEPTVMEALAEGSHVVAFS
jgi:L-seryl-tRNA(Ser) seleniumtransferase